MRKNRVKLFLVLILLFGFILRVWRLGSYPPLLWDEASLGYNAYSILKTGKDEYGSFLPLIFKSFGDYKPGFYIYLTTPFVGLFGLSELSVRLPNLILGSLTPLVLYLLIKEIFKKERLALFSAAVLALLPWHFHFSRGSWETNVLVFFLTLGSLFFIKALKKEKYLFFSSLSFLFGLWTYQGAKMMVPLILFGLFFFYWKNLGQLGKKIKENKKVAFLSGIVILLMSLWFAQSFSGAARNRLEVMGLFSYHRPVEEITSLLKEDGLERKNLHFYVFHGEWLHLVRGFSTRYFNHFSPQFLAFEGDWSNPRHSAPYFGMIGHLNLVLLVLGLIMFLKQKQKKESWFLFFWLLVSPLPAALSRDIISGVRSLGMVIPLSFFIANGLEWTWRTKSKLLIISVGFLLFIDLAYHQNLYFNHLLKRSPENWLYGYKQAVELIKEKEDQVDQVVFSDYYGQPYIYYLFYSQYPPAEYQTQAALKENVYGDVGKVERLDNLHFRLISWETDSIREKTLIIASHQEIIRASVTYGEEVFSQLTPLGEINNKIMFWVNEND